MGGKSMFLVGGLVLLIGVLWLFNNLGLTNISLGNLITTYWPVILVLWGFDVLGQEFLGRRNQQEKRERNFSSIITGLILLVIGLLILGRNLKFFHFDISLFWKIF
jgi:lia operon protein LiaF